MKKFYFLLLLFVVGLSAKASTSAFNQRNPFGYGDAFIFNEGGVEFAIFQDGQFDFYFNPRGAFPRFAGRDPFSFNHGFNYDPFVQYDDFGAVIQIERVPVYYDHFGRIIQAGRVPIYYNAFGIVRRIGNLYLDYDRFGRLARATGYINAGNRFYTYRPWHDFYRRPPMYAEIVYSTPYRAYYYPERYDYGYYRNYYERLHNTEFRRSYYRPGDRITSYYRGRRTESQIEDRPSLESELRSNQNSEKARPTDVRSVRKATSRPRSADDQVRNRAARSSQDNNLPRRNSAVEPLKVEDPQVRLQENNQPQKVEERGTRSSRGRGNL